MRFPFPPYPNGWFAIGFASDFPVGAVVTRHYFGQDLVVYRTESGALHATEPHCPHVGAHLGHGGRVVGERLRCPFHGWCFDGDGRCVEIPGASRIPLRAELRTWTVHESGSVVFAHHHADGAPPAWEVPAWPDAGWSRNRSICWTVRTHPQEVAENVVDQAHLVPLHGCDAASILRPPLVEHHRFNIAIRLTADGAIVGMPGTINDVTLDVTAHGLGDLMVAAEVHNAGIHARQRILCTPIDDERTDIRGVVGVQDLGDPELTEQVGELFYQAYVTDFAMDFPVWENKVYRERPVLSSADGPFMVYRKWARQFYRGEEAIALARNA
jgi:nitrite reductase/ring-hydroxylating ferredoxin subunit